MVNNIKNNTISEIDAKKDLNKLNEIKNVETMKYKKRAPEHKELLNLFNDLLDIILSDKTLESKIEENENGKVESKQEENEDDDDDIIKILTFSNEHVETKNQNEKDIMIKKLNDYLNEIIDKSKSFEDQIKSIRKIKNLDDYYYINDFGNKKFKFKIFKLKHAHLSNDIIENLFEKLFDHKFETLANKLINTTNKEENQIIVKNIKTKYR